MKKAAFIILSFLLFMFPFNEVVDAEEGVCSYTLGMIHGVSNSPTHFEKIYVNYEFRIEYDENNYKVVMLDENGNYTQNYIDGLVNFDDTLTHQVWMDGIKKNNSCPYYIIVGIEGLVLFDRSKVFIQPKKFGLLDPPIKWMNRNIQEIAVCKDCVVEDFDPIFTDEISDCSSLIGPNVMVMINTGMNYIKIIVPILVIALGTFDFVRAVLSSSEDDMKKIQKTFVRRLIIAVIIFMSPYFVNLIIQITNSVAGFSNGGTCGIF